MVMFFLTLSLPIPLGFTLWRSGPSARAPAPECQKLKIVG